MEAKPRPLLGSFLGLLLGIFVVALLWQLGVVPPDRLIFFGVLSVAIALVTIILTQRTVLVRKRFILVMLLSGLLAGVAVAGIPETIAGGSISDGCSATGTSSLDSKTPDQTSLADAFDVTRTDTVQWTAESAGVFTNWTSALGMKVGGFPVKIWGGSSANEDGKQSNSGSADVASYLADIEGGTGITLTGIYHVYGHLNADEGTCDMSAYVRLPSEGAFAGTLNMGLWIALGGLILIIAIMAGVVRHSITRAARAAVGPSAAAVATAPPPKEKLAAEPVQRTDAGRQAQSETDRRPRKQADKPERPARETPGREPHARDEALGEPMGAEGQDPMLGGEQVMEQPATGDALGDADELGGSSPAVEPDAPDAPPSGDEKP